MPVRFRCSGCRSTLSTARRKAGTAIACPNCRATVTVPSAEFAGEWVVGQSRAKATNGTATAPPPNPEPPPPIGEEDLDDLPLFERTDFAELLEPAVREEKANQPPPPEPPRAATPPDGILILRSTATLLVAAVVVLLGLAFTAGFLVGSK